MLKLVTLVSLLLSAGWPILAKTEEAAGTNRLCEVTFRVVARTLPAESKVFIVGNDEKLGQWNPQAVALERQPDGSWQRTFRFESGTKLEYKFTQGSWLTEAVSAAGIVPANLALLVQSNQTVTIEVANWRDAVTRPTGQITGTVKYHRAMTGEGIKPRDVGVWLPPSYAAASERRYPVLYVHDGQNAFDPTTSFLGVDWQIDETADRLIREGKLQEIIVVGIYNSDERRQDYSDTPKGRAYMKFVVENLKPFIDRAYRTLPGRDQTAVMGSSMGGLISFLLAWNYPQVFSQAACLSPAFVYNVAEVDAVALVDNYTGTNKAIRLYVDNGGVGLESQLQPGVEAMLRALQAHGFEMGKNLEWYHDLEAEHSERAWSKRVWRPLLFLFGKKGATTSPDSGTTR
jgi:predicted alpha/beta superfamily hydrolase